MNPYRLCPEYVTKRFFLRLVRTEDAQDLLRCYSDASAVARMNSDACTNDFYYTNIEQMQQAINFWLQEYKEERYVRFSIIERCGDRAIGTVEIFGGAYGVLRIDLCSVYETTDVLCELVACAVCNFYDDFNILNMCVKMMQNTPERNAVMQAFGFVPSEEYRSGMNYWLRKRKDPVAFCGLACSLCEHDKNCVGCQQGGCEAHGWCKNYICCRECGLDGCWECSDFPCNDSMLDKPRIRAFASFAKQFGVEELTACMMRNRLNGTVYHKNGSLVGDYDKCKTQAEIFAMLGSDHAHRMYICQ